MISLKFVYVLVFILNDAFSFINYIFLSIFVKTNALNYAPSNVKTVIEGCILTGFYLEVLCKMCYSVAPL